MKSTERGKCFIEYIPAENAWNPIKNTQNFLERMRSDEGQYIIEETGYLGIGTKTE